MKCTWNTGNRAIVTRLNTCLRPRKSPVLVLVLGMFLLMVWIRKDFYQLFSLSAIDINPSCSLHSDRKGADVDFVIEAVRIITEAAEALEIPVILTGGSALNALRWGSVALRWENKDVFNDVDLDFYAIYRAEEEKDLLFSKMYQLSNTSNVVKCSGNICTPKRNISGGDIPAIMPCMGCKDKITFLGGGIVRAGVDSAYYNGSTIDFALSGRAERVKYDLVKIFPLLDVRIFDTKAKVPNDFIWFFSRQVPYVLEETFLGKGPEYGRGCFALSFPRSLIKLVFGDFDFSDSQYSKIRDFESEAILCSKWLASQGFASFIDCFLKP